MRTNTIVMDFGTNKTRVGFAGRNTPDFTFSNPVSWNGSTTLADDTVAENSANSITDNITDKRTDFKQTVSHAFNLLNVNPAEQSVLITEPPMMSKSRREQVVKILFEDFDVPTVTIMNNAVLSLFAADRMTGIVLHAESEVIYTVPILDAYILTHAVDKARRKSHQLTLNELLEAPSLVNPFVSGLHKAVYHAVMKCGETIRTRLFENIILSGDITLSPDTKSRLERAIERLTLNIYNARMTAPAARKNSTWIGGSLAVGRLISSENRISRKDYHSGGAAIIHQKML